MKIWVVQNNEHPAGAEKPLGLSYSKTSPSIDSHLDPISNSNCTSGSSNSSSSSSSNSTSSTSSSGSILATSRNYTSPNPSGTVPMPLERSTSNNSSSSGSGSKKSVQFVLDHNQICEPIPPFQIQALDSTADTVLIQQQPPHHHHHGSSAGSSIISSSEFSDNNNNYHNGSIHISKNTSPFRPGGRGSKMLAKAIEQSQKSATETTNNEISSEMAIQMTEPQWVLCTGKHPCFAKVMSVPSPDSSSVFIQPMHRRGGDPSLLVPWEGHLWLAKSNRLHPVKMKQEPGGWRVIESPEILEITERLKKENKSNTTYYPASYSTTVQKGGTGAENWDVVSLESSEFDETGSADSGNSNTLFPLLGAEIAVIQPQQRMKGGVDDGASSSSCSSYSSTSSTSSSMLTPSPMLQTEQNKTVKASSTVCGMSLKSWPSPRRTYDQTTSSPQSIGAMSGTTEIESNSSSPSRYLALSTDESFSMSPATMATSVRRPGQVQGILKVNEKGFILSRNIYA